MAECPQCGSATKAIYGIGVYEDGEWTGGYALACLDCARAAAA